jgi:peptidoglycan/LPS O-acetylase OafA/YrhL
VVVADAYLKKEPMPLAKSPALIWASLIISAYFLKPLEPLSFTFSSLLAATVLCKCLKNERQTSGPPNFFLEQLRRLGVYSYSFYLLHQPLLLIFTGRLTVLFPQIHPLIKLSICMLFLLIVTMLAAIWYRFIEVPGIELGRRIIQYRRVLKISAEKTFTKSADAVAD